MTSKGKKTRIAKPTNKRLARKQQLSLLARFMQWLAAFNDRLTDRYQNFLSRRPHRSFKLTRRRDYVRSLALPGYVAFTAYVNKTLRAHWRMFGLLIFIYATIMVALGAITSQDTYTTINELLRKSTTDFFGAGLGQIGQAGAVALSAFATSSNNLSADQHVYLVISLLFAWLCTVWLLREILLGRKPVLRDGLYSSGSPVLALCGVLLVIIIQMLPIGVLAVLYGGFSSVGMLDGGFGNMLFGVAAAVVVAMVLYWISSSIIALVIVTLPGMYPLRAVRLAGDLVIGRRLRIMLRLLWGIVMALLTWALVLIVVILLNNWVSSLWSDINRMPIVPYMGAFMTAYAVVWYAAYVYLFYRKVVDDDAKPA